MMRMAAHRFVAVLVGFLFSILLSSCSGGGSTSSTTGDGGSTVSQKATVLVYMVGSDLESGGGAGTTDIEEMMRVGSNDNLKVVVETGGANKDGWRTVKRKLINQGSETELSDQGNLNMGNPTTLQDFIAWGVSNYPADKYVLILWDHGGGAIGDSTTGATFGLDENNGNDGLSLPELKQALQNAYSTTGKKFDIIGFDACLMATLETAHTVSSYAKYLVASEELEPGHGWNYTAILSTIKSNPSIGGSALGQVITDGYKAHALAQEPESAPTITLSVVDLSFIPNVITSLEALANTAGADLQNSGQSAYTTIAKGRSRAEDYGNDEKTKRYPDMADLKHIANNLSATYPTETNNLIAAINSAVVYKVNGAARPNASGLSIFLPHKNINNPDLASMVQAYNNIDFSTAYKDFIGQYTNLGDQDDTAPTFASESLTGNVYSAQVQGGDVDVVYAVITQGDPATGTVLIIGTDSVDMDAAGNVSYPWDGQWVTMDGNFVSMTLEDKEDNIETYSIPALLNGQGVDILAGC